MAHALRGRMRALALVALLPIAAAGLPGCMFRDLHRNLQQKSRFSALRGTVSADPGVLAPDGGTRIVVFAYSGEPPDARIVDGFVLPRPGQYFLIVPVGAYRVAAFEDRNGNRALEPDEPIGLLQDGAPIAAGPAEPQVDLNLVLRGTRPEGLGFPVAVDANSVVGIDDFPQPHIGEIVRLDDPRFSQAAAQGGLWRPIEFLFEVGAGIYFLEPYDPDRIPVLFVHGAVGSPANWRFLVEHLDRSRFQPWLVYYPTAVRLEITAAAIGRWLHALDVTYDYRRPVIVAHSMGGLVARALINQQHALDLPDDVEPGIFVTISTPWRGHPAAARGVERAPVVAPSWHDMAPDSELLQQLLRDPLPTDLAYYLFFSYSGSSRLSSVCDDGVITLSSQLDHRAQDRATRVIGFDATHRSVLSSPLVADELGRLLAPR